MTITSKIKRKKYFLKYRLLKPISSKKIKYKKELYIDKSQISLINQTTFKVYKIYTNNNCYYFRQIRKHTYFNEYIKSLLDEYFYFINTSLSLKEIELVYDVILNIKTIKKLYDIGEVYNKDSLIYNFFNTKDYSIFHIERLNKINKEETINLMQFLWGSIYQYHLNCGVKNGNYETFNSNREISAKKVSDLLGISYLIPNIKIAKVTIDNNYSMIGTLMDEAEGISPYDISMSKRKNFTSQFSLDLSSLNIMDAINTEKDHRPGNYNIVYKDGKIITLQAFDNDSPESFGFSFNINLKTYLGGGAINK